MAPEDIIAKHIASLGKSDVVAASKNRMAIADGKFEIVAAAKSASGRAVLASNGSNEALFSTFNMTDYKMERIGLFDDKMDIPFVVPGRRSPLGTFLWTYNKFLESRLLGGSIFSSWLFSQPHDSWGKLETEGKKKIGDRDTWVIKYTPKNGGLTGESFIRLYFDTENFHHLRTVYYQKEREGGFATIGASDPSTTYNGVSAAHGWDADMASNGSTLMEDFEDIRDDAGLTLPHKYSIMLAVNGAAGTGKYKYDFTIEEYRLIKEFPANFFHFESGPPK